MAGTFIALVRGVNVVGKNSMPTKDFIRILESIGLKNVRTYIQTGNAVFEANKAATAGLAEKIKAKIKAFQLKL
jgi:uncharacterized protein (DUF1697 family)